MTIFGLIVRFRFRGAFFALIIILFAGSFIGGTFEVLAERLGLLITLVAGGKDLDLI